MKENNSPWLAQLSRTRPEISLREHITSDVLIVGGGIAGISTLYYTLTKTNRSVVLLEARRIAHGATGHNAGYVVSEFEKPYKEIVAEYGKELADAGVASIEGAWALLDELAAVAGTDLPRETLVSWGGYRHFEQFLNKLEDTYASLGPKGFLDKVLVSDESLWLEALPEHLAALCSTVPTSVISRALETRETIYHGAIPSKTVVTNSAMLTERVLEHCLRTYPKRVRVYEHSPVHGIELNATSGMAYCGEYTIVFNEIVLATNGFEDFYIKNNAGEPIDSAFHHQVHGVVGYMTGYLTNHPPHSAAMYFYRSSSTFKDPYSAEPYFYMTRRDFKTDSHQKLISIGGPEVHLEYREKYYRDYDVAREIYDSIDIFLQAKEGVGHWQQQFRWHGLMGYTESGLRLVGREPENPLLLYNLGCNGIGILTSIYGGRTIARHLSGETVPPSIFDPKRRQQDL
ncbi:FAD-binding oxidoreductase [Candidatus Nomurabacteria bacterium]|nr:FAD-binding oxidoreductase [Candidatus Nomurabacteria bacterium]